MIQDIKPHIFHNEFKNLKPDANDKAIVFDGKNFLVKRDENDTLHMPGCSDIEGDYQYVFSVDDTRYFLFKGWEYAEREGEVERYIRRYEKHLEGFKFENISCIAKHYILLNIIYYQIFCIAFNPLLREDILNPVITCLHQPQALCK